MHTPADDSRKRGLLRLKHHQEQHEARAEAQAALAPRFARLADPASAPRVVTAFNLFQTPEPIADQMAEHFADHPAPLGRPVRWLEPSAGLGRLYLAAVRATMADPLDAHDFTLVEESHQLTAELYRLTEPPARPARLIRGDFLETTAEQLGRFDRIIMNPPFKNGIDIRHIQHARGLLAPGGLLVALCAAGPRQHRDLQPIAETWQLLPPGSFRSEGTSVDVVLLTIRA